MSPIKVVALVLLAVNIEAASLYTEDCNVYAVANARQTGLNGRYVQADWWYSGYYEYQDYVLIYKYVTDRYVIESEQDTVLAHPTDTSLSGPWLELSTSDTSCSNWTTACWEESDITVRCADDDVTEIPEAAESVWSDDTAQSTTPHTYRHVYIFLPLGLIVTGCSACALAYRRRKAQDKF